MHQCLKCGEFKSPESFSRGGGRRETQCKACRNLYSKLKRETDPEWRARRNEACAAQHVRARKARLEAEKGYTCSICDKPTGNKLLALDHDHKTGVVRGLLCHGCNVGLGLFLDSPSLLKRAAEYLHHHQEYPTGVLFSDVYSKSSLRNKETDQ